MLGSGTSIELAEQFAIIDHVSRWTLMAKMTYSKSAPRNMRATYQSIVALTDSVCHDHLNDEYRELAQRMAATLCRMRSSPVTSGQPRTWACAIIHELGRINFLSDRSTQPYMTMADVCSAFGVGQSTASAKARVISQMLKTHQLDPKWSLPSFVGCKPSGMDGRGQWLFGRFAAYATRGPGDRIPQRHDSVHLC